MNAKTLIKATFLFLVLGLFMAESADAQRNRREKASEAPKKEAMFPDAVRAEPKIKQSQRVQRDVQKLIKANEEENFDEVISVGESLAANKLSGAYERALAYQLIGVARIEKDDYPGAIDAFQKSYDADGLDNNEPMYDFKAKLAPIDFTPQALRREGN